MLPVKHVISVIDVVHIDIVGAVPDGRPGFRAGINHTKPEASELETRGTFDYDDGYIVDAKPVSTAKMGAEAIFRNAVSVVAAAFVPGVMLTLPIVRTLTLPDVLPDIAGPGSDLLTSRSCRRRMPAVSGPLWTESRYSRAVQARVHQVCRVALELAVRARVGERCLPARGDHR